MDIKEIKRLVGLVENANISHLSIENDGSKIEIKKQLNAAPAVETVIPVAAAPQVVAPAGAAPAEVAEASNPDDGLIPIKAQMVGTFYASPNPDSPAFVKEGDKIKVGQVICIVEAMKLFNEIESEQIGTVERVCAGNGDAIEFGQTLFMIRP